MNREHGNAARDVRTEWPVWAGGPGSRPYAPVSAAAQPQGESGRPGEHQDGQGAAREQRRGG
ncbi:hypothetical protein, partial [Streptomyces sp. SM1]|uniref:hypothetical protein n=1 Tax=Streptomyces sp. SM1 TaxID=402229 RepID=UPI0035BC2F36